MTLLEMIDAPPATLDALPALTLMGLKREADAQMSEASKVQAILHDVLARRYARGRNDTGTAHVQDGGVDIAVTIPKRIKWDQAKLAAVADTIAAEWKEDVREYIDIDMKVAERKFEAWPSAVKSVFADARTVETGKPTFKLTLIEDAREAA